MKVKNNYSNIELFTASSTVKEKITRCFHDLLPFIAIGGAIASAKNKRNKYVDLVTNLSLLYIGRKVAQSIIGYIAYPAASSSVFNREATISRRDYYNGTFTPIQLRKSGCEYGGYMLKNRSNAKCDNWMIFALGNGMSAEDCLEYAYQETKDNLNVLVINGPSVGSSARGPFFSQPTRYQLGAGFEAALQYLEENGAKKIIMKGLSLGGGMMAEGVLQHDFAAGKEKGIKYLAISDRTFTRLSSTAASLIGMFVYPVFWLSGAELNGVAGGKKLSREKIQHIVINNPNGDGVINAQVALSRGLKSEDHKLIVEDFRMFHNGDLPSAARDQVVNKISEFTAQT